MVTFISQRRIRVHPEEVPEVIEGLILRLQQHLRTREDLLGATVAFRTYYRFSTYRRGRPGYPSPVTWDVIDSFVNEPISVVEDNNIRVPTSPIEQLTLSDSPHSLMRVNR